VHMDDIVITGDDTKGIDSLKKHLQKHFKTKDLESLKYFLSIKVVKSQKDILLSQRKYVLDLLSEAGMLGCRSIDSPMDVNTKLLPYQGSFLRMLRGTRIERKTGPPDDDQTDITFADSVVSQFLLAFRTIHLEAVTGILRYLNKALERGLI